MNVGDFIFYHEYRTPYVLVGKVIGIYNGDTSEVRTDSDGMQVPLGVSTRTDWIWVDGRYVLPEWAQ